MSEQRSDNGSDGERALPAPDAEATTSGDRPAAPPDLPVPVTEPPGRGLTVGRVAAGLAGAAVAAAVGAAAVSYVRNTAPSRGVRTYHVEPHEGGWVVTAAGETSPSSAHSTKSEALAAGRELARSNEPSRLVIHRGDGSVMSTDGYGIADSPAEG